MILEIGILIFLIAMMFLVFVAITYIGVIGRIGLQFFRLNFPLTKKRGAWYLILLKDGRFQLVYKKFQSIWQWKDSETHISKKFDRISQSAEPLIFLIEGFPTNVRLFNQLPKAEISKFVNNITKEAYSTGRLVEEDDQKTGGFLKYLPLIGVVLTVIIGLISLAIFLNLSDLTEVLNQLKPYIPQAIEALENSPREI